MNDSPNDNDEDALDSRLLDDYDDPNPFAATISLHPLNGSSDNEPAGAGAGAGAGIHGQSATTTRTTTTRTTEMLPKLQVTAPETLPEGYTFDVQVNDVNASARQVYTLRVPRGGIRKGDIFTTTPITANTSTHNHASYEQQRHTIPRNAWKDSIWDICKFGPTHSHFLIGCCCPCISLGQIFTRLNVNLYEEPLPDYSATTVLLGGNESDASNGAGGPNGADGTSSCRLSKRDTTTFRLLVALNFMYFSLIMVVVMTEYDTIPFHHFHFLYLLIVTILAARMRFYLRTTLDIPTIWQSLLLARNGRRFDSTTGTSTGAAISSSLSLLDEEATLCGTRVDAATVLGVVEDVAVNACCGPCSIMQMNRHTGLYETYQGHYFNSTGMPKYAPLVVV